MSTHTDAVHERIKAGEPVTPSELAEAKAADELATLTAAAERARAAEEAEAQRQQRIADLEHLIRTHFGRHDGDIVDAFDTAIETLAPLIESVRTYNARLREIKAQLAAVGPLPSGAVINAVGQIHLSGVDVFINEVDVLLLLKEAVWRALVAADELHAAGRLQLDAGIAHDPQAARHFGVPPRSDGATGPVGLSDRLRRIARIVAERDAA